MPIYKPSELRLFLDQLGISPKKGLSQNFLIDGNIIRKIVAVSEVHPEDTILEVGPGPGSLTQALLETGARVLAVEKDEVLAQALQRLQTPTQQLTVFCHDILTFPLQEELRHLTPQGQKAKVIANLPYHLTTPILIQLSPLRELFSSLTVMVQEEVARRMTAQPGMADYGSLTIFLRFYTHPHYAFTVSRNCFYPAPKVNSAIVVLKLREPPLTGEDVTTFFQLTRTAFEHRRKMLRASLKTLFPSQSIENALEAMGQNPLARPETLSLEEFLKLHASLYHRS
jgi:16S rRNA (adenine1518-N6/adenine1519-N6)-dimethyltransferase